MWLASLLLLSVFLYIHITQVKSCKIKKKRNKLTIMEKSITLDCMGLLATTTHHLFLFSIICNLFLLGMWAERTEL